MKHESEYIGERENKQSDFHASRVNPRFEGVPADADGEGIGEQIRQLRKARGWSLTQLSQQCGRSIGLLSQIERGTSQPNVLTLKAIANALGVQVGWFFPAGAPAPARERGLIVRAPARKRLTFEGGVANDLLSPNLEGPLELLQTTLEPGARSGDAFAHGGHECGLVLSGELQLSVDGESHTLLPGDSFSFSSGRKHWFSNPGQVPTVVVWVLTPPSY